MSFKARMNKIEERITILQAKNPERVMDEHRKKAIDLWEVGSFAELKEHLKDDPQFYKRLIEYHTVIERMEARGDYEL